eukprot:CAMPEP_0183309220 /NCGR_PEP_ID=MMETSP0160_2-20130417/24554_1 /TAXON_ID=2839 ORGANISM="Odontella Sinensis, Strain Grunow 1884" /NCGR_SAMPLE_ID=MMETSP0160_2 /ASSEMBLY_ACC=CAM_ASM_000250 /LENGTH=707 /DNA_ID=CAMNT_0025473215 /DNA_START=58 /DNA_END=2181 /DNA_ORIENTATION=-
MRLSADLLLLSLALSGWGTVRAFVPPTPSFVAPPSLSSAASASASSSSSSSLRVSIGLGPDEEKSASATVEDEDAEAVEAELIEEPDHELHRLDRLSKGDVLCDDWYGALLGDGDDGDDGDGFLGRVSAEARRRIMEKVELKREEVISDRDSAEWTPYVTGVLPGSVLYPSYGLERYGLPTPRKGAEAWRQFDVMGMVGQDYSLSPEGIGTDLDLDEDTAAAYKSTLIQKGAWLDDDSCTARLVYVNGRYCPSLSKSTDVARNLSPSDFDEGGSVTDEMVEMLNRLTDGFTDELAAEVDSGGSVPLTSYKKLSGPDHNLGEPTAQSAINSQQGTACFAALNSARAGGVAYIDIPATEKGDDEEEGSAEDPKPILIVNAQTVSGGSDPDAESGKGVAFHPRLLAVAGKNAQASIVQSCVDLEDAEEGDETFRPRLHNGYTQIFVGEGANVTHTYLGERGGIVTSGVEGGEATDDVEAARAREAARPALKDTHLEMIDVHITGEDGSYRTSVMDMGGSGRSRVCHSSSLLKFGAHADINGFVLSGGAQRTDMKTNIHHIAQGTTSHQIQKNMIGGRATSSFRGRIRVEQSAQQTDSEQLSRTVLLSDRARVWTVPSLEIIADDVKCAHGATVSDLSEEELFYLRSRGLDPEMARNLLMYAFVDDVSLAADPTIRGAVDSKTGLRARCIERLQNLVPKGERAIKGEFQSV